MRALTNPIPGVVYQSAEDLEEYRSLGLLNDETLIGAYEKTFTRHPDRVAISEAGREITHRELNAIADRWAAALNRLGLAPLDRVLFQIGNSKELLFAVFGCLKAGLIPVCTLASHREVEIGYLGNLASAKAHIVHGDDKRFDLVTFARKMRGEISSLRHTLVVRATGPLPDDTLDLAALGQREDVDAAGRLVASIPRDSLQVTIFQLSGGTSAVSKIIPRFNFEYLHSIECYAKMRHMDHTTVGYTPSPMMHNAPMIAYWGPVLLSGGEIAICTSLDPQEIGEVMRKRKPNWLGMPPVMMHRLRETGAVEKGQFAGALGMSMSNSAAQMREFTGAPIYHQFGMTEGFICNTRRGDPQEALDTTVGAPLSPLDKFKILKPGTEEEVARGEVGEMVSRGPNTTRGYFNAPERDRELLTSDGYVRSGDLMRVKIIGGKEYLCFEGRIKDVVSRGGEKINCQEVEQFAVAHPKIAAIAIVPMPDPHYGERACAFVILSNKGTPIAVPELGEFLESKGLAKFKWPERIELVDEFPMTRSGKLSKPMLREMIEKKLLQQQQEPAAVAAGR